MSEKKLYEYSGPIHIFDQIVNECWRGMTFAVSEKKARCNLAFQYKQERGLLANTKVALTGAIKEVS